MAGARRGDRRRSDDRGDACRGRRDPRRPRCRPGLPARGARGPVGRAGIAAADGTSVSAADQSNTSVVLGEAVLLKAYRRLQPGLNPDLELTALPVRGGRVPGVPRLAGYAEVVTRRASGVATVAMLQAFVADGADVYEAPRTRLADCVARPGPVEPRVRDGGRGGPRAARRRPPRGARVAAADARTWRRAAADPRRAPRLARRRAPASSNAAIAAPTGGRPRAAAELRDAAPEIAAPFSRFEAVATAPLVIRVHADLHLGQVLVAGDGYRVIDFEGDPLRADRGRARRPDSPLRDVASMLRVARPRRAERPPARRGAERRPDRAARPRRGGVDRAGPGAVPRRLRRRPAAVRGPDRRGPRPPRRVRGRQGDHGVRVRGDGAAVVAVGAARGDALAAGARPINKGQSPHWHRIRRGVWSARSERLRASIEPAHRHGHGRRGDPLRLWQHDGHVHPGVERRAVRERDGHQSTGSASPARR